MKKNQLHFAQFLLVSAALFLSSCVVPGPIYSDDYGSGSYYPSGSIYGGGYSSSRYYGGSGYGYGGYPGGYYNSRGVCSICGYNPCRCKRGHDDHGSSHRTEYRVLGGDLGNKVKPDDYHSREWYQSRGYDVNRLRLQDEHGHVIDNRPSSSHGSSSSHRTSSSSSSGRSSSGSGHSSSGGSSTRSRDDGHKSSSSRSSSSSSGGGLVKQAWEKKR